MRRLADIKGEHALDMLADLIEPIGEIMTDEKVRELARADNRLGAVKEVIKGHKKAIIYVLAVLNEEDPATYEPSIIALPAMLLELFNDPDMTAVFQWQGQEQKSSGSAMENTEGTGEA